MAYLRACLELFYGLLRGCLGLFLWPIWSYFYSKLRGYLELLLWPTKGSFGVVLWAYYISYLAMRIKGVVTRFCNNMLGCCCLIKC